MLSVIFTKKNKFTITQLSVVKNLYTMGFRGLHRLKKEAFFKFSHTLLFFKRNFLNNAQHGIKTSLARLLW